MENREEILNELRDLHSSLANVDNHNVYSVPNGYFASFSNEIITRIKQDELLSSNNPFSVPENYFSNLADNILSKIKQQNNSEVYIELQQIAPLLNTINKQNIYSVPENYFNQFTINVHTKQKAKIVSFSKFRKFTNYAAAAIIAGVLVTGAFIYNGKSSKNSFDLKSEVKKVSDEELQEYLSSNTVHPYLIQEENTISNNIIDVKEEMQFVPDDELKQYLQENEAVNKTNNKEKASS
jgi:hypothetical protein